jgi:endonuclease YncB( thermonuclease family)
MGNRAAKLILSYETNDTRKIYKITGKYICKVVDVYDGDTATISLINNCQIQKLKLRMYGYDSPELKPRLDKVNRDEEIKKAKEAKQFLSDLVLDKICTVDTRGFDKYGRLLGTLYAENVNINELMVSHGHGYEYYGGKKK